MRGFLKFGFNRTKKRIGTVPRPDYSDERFEWPSGRWSGKPSKHDIGAVVLGKTAKGRFAPVAPNVLHRPVAPKKQSVR